MFIITFQTSYLVKSNIILYTWQIWHPCGIVHLIVMTNVTRNSHSNVTPCDCSVTFDDMTTLKLKKIMQFICLKFSYKTK
jgi:hypothetical protein